MDKVLTIIAGGRDYVFTQQDHAFLDALLDTISAVVEGGAKGADLGGKTWARSHGLVVTTFPANWDRHGKAAGFIRNEDMARAVGEGGQCILFPGGKGTAHMRNLAAKYKLKIIDAPHHG